jgi:hypothetical protein
MAWKEVWAAITGKATPRIPGQLMIKVPVDGRKTSGHAFELSV